MVWLTKKMSLCCILIRSALLLVALVSHAEAAEAKPNQYRSFPAVTQPQQGISWPQGQALPHFASPAVVDTIEVQALTRDEQITFSALQGQVNRKQPRIYLLNARTDEGRLTWVQTSTVNLTLGTNYTRENKYELLAKYAHELKGAVLYDPSVNPHHRNLAGTIAGLRGALPITSEIEAQCREHGINLKTLVDLRELTFSSPIEIYEHLFTNYWEQCSRRLILSARPTDRGGDFHHTRDLAAAVGAAVVWLDSRVPAERDLLRKFFRGMKAGDAVALGWYATERSGITTASEFGIGTLPSDHYLNATVFSGMAHHIQVPPVPKMPDLEKKAYIALFISDGDNIQYSQRAMRRIWDQNAAVRGKFPLNWTIAPGLVDIGPALLNYYYGTATANDCFVSGPSGMGYLMPFNTLTEPGAPLGLYLADAGRMEGYARLTETYLQRSGLRVITIWDDATPMQRAAYEKHCRNLYGATVQNFKDVPAVEGSIVNDRVRFDKLIIPYAASFEHLHRSLTTELERWEQDSPLFLAYQSSIWSELKPARLVELCQQLSARFSNQVEFVRADHYFNLYNQAHDLPFNLSLTRDIKVRDGSSGTDSERVLDGTPNTIWSASGKASLEFDLGEPCRISRYVIRHAGTDRMDRSLNTRKFSLAASRDGHAWKTVDQRQDNSEAVTDINLDTIEARYLRLKIDDPGADNISRIADVEIFGQPVL
jgi:hypothetical protein